MENELIKDNISKNIEQFILPYLDQLKRKSSYNRKHIETLEAKLKSLTSDFGVKISQSKWKLTVTEQKICAMIKDGMTTKQLAGFLNTSVRTIDNHRNHIRKKLKISNEQISLDNFLKNL